jgi:hypothetical protein
MRTVYSRIRLARLSAPLGMSRADSIQPQSQRRAAGSSACASWVGAAGTTETTPSPLTAITPALDAKAIAAPMAVMVRLFMAVN